jgi:hypothetical protein
VGYKISYENGGAKTEKITKSKFSRKQNVFRFGVFIVTAVLLLVLHRSKSFCRFFIPGNPEVTEAAVVEFVESVRQGNRFEDAVTAFCQQIIDNGK